METSVVLTWKEGKEKGDVKTSFGSLYLAYHMIFSFRKEISLFLGSSLREVLGHLSGIEEGWRQLIC